MIVFLPFINLNFPPNVNIFMDELIKIATLDPFPKIDEFIDLLFDFEIVD